MKKIAIPFLLAFADFAILGGLFGIFTFLPQFAVRQKSFPDAIKSATDFISGFVVRII